MGYEQVAAMHFVYVFFCRLNQSLEFSSLFLASGCIRPLTEHVIGAHGIVSGYSNFLSETNNIRRITLNYFKKRAKSFLLNLRNLMRKSVAPRLLQRINTVDYLHNLISESNDDRSSNLNICKKTRSHCVPVVI